MVVASPCPSPQPTAQPEHGIELILLDQLPQALLASPVQMTPDAPRQPSRRRHILDTDPSIPRLTGGRNSRPQRISVAQEQRRGDGGHQQSIAPADPCRPGSVALEARDPVSKAIGIA